MVHEFCTMARKTEYYALPPERPLETQQGKAASEGWFVRRGTTLDL